MEWQQTAAGFRLRGAVYEAIWSKDNPDRIRIEFDAQKFAQLPVVSALDKVSGKEKLSHIRFSERVSEEGCAHLTFDAESNLWNTRRFYWRFYERHIEFSHTARGEGSLGRCFFFSTGKSAEYADGDSQGHTMNLQLHVPHYFTPNINHAHQEAFDISQPCTTGLRGELTLPSPDELFLPEKYNGLFTPAPLCMAFLGGCGAMGVGIGTPPGGYRFNALEYTGSKYAGAAMYVNYLGYTHANGEFKSPEAALHFGYGPFDVLERHVAWIDKKGYGTSFRFDTPAWHRAPFFCGWAEQTAEANRGGLPAGERATQANYEKWIERAEALNLPLSTIVIDDKWQKGYGSFDVDEQKWPDMKRFIDEQHRKGRHVLLWVPGYHIEGVPDEWCAKDKNGRKLFANPANPEYESFLRERIAHLIGEIGADGFKEDWIAPSAREIELSGYGELHGIELLRRFQFILHDAAHRVKPDALVETQTPHPLLRESSDVLRLNDIWYATREVPRVLRTRARVARIAGWRVLDCDNASSTTVDEWFAYAQAQPLIGTPSLYFVNETEVTHEKPSGAQWQYLSALWHEYLDKN